VLVEPAAECGPLTSAHAVGHDASDAVLHRQQLLLLLGSPGGSVSRLGCDLCIEERIEPRLLVAEQLTTSGTVSNWQTTICSVHKFLGQQQTVRTCSINASDSTCI
jgi:hypothetical protein